MNRAAASSLADVAMVIFVVDGMTWTADDEMVLSKLRRGGEERQTILAINKVDNIKDKESLFPYLEEVAKNILSMKFCRFLPVKALTLSAF